MATDLNTIILNTIKDGSKYGLEIIDEIKQKTNGEIVLKQPSLYSALRRLELKGYVSSYWKDSELGGKRHYYQATKQGIEALDSKRRAQNATEAYIKGALQQNALDDKSDLPTIKNVDPFFDDENFDDDEPQDQKSSINYKTILGDFLTDEDELEETNKPEVLEQPPKKVENKTVVVKNEKKENKEEKEEKKASTPSENSNTSQYVKELETLFKSSPKEEEKKEKEPEEKPQKKESLNDVISPSNMFMLESAAKKYNESIIQQSVNSEDVQNAWVNKINEKKKISELDIKRNERKYLLVNKMNFVSGLCILFSNIAIYSILFLLYIFKGWISVDKYIIIGVGVFIAVVIALVDIFAYYKYPEKRINEQINWWKSLALRFFVFVLLCVATISINLLIGMESFKNMFGADFLVRWFVPIVASFNIIIRWIVNYILHKNIKYNSTIEKK